MSHLIQRGRHHIAYEPLDFISKLAALVPRPHKNLVIYHGVLAANAAWRERVVAYGRPAHEVKPAIGNHEPAPPEQLPRHLRRQWAELMRRGLGLDVLACPKCGGRLRLLGLIIERSTVRKLLAHAKLPLEPPLPVSVGWTPSPAHSSTQPERAARSR